MLYLTQRLEIPAAATASVTLPIDVRVKSRVKVTLNDGREAGLLLPRGLLLRGGDVLSNDKGTDFEQVIDYKTKLQELLQVNGDVEIVYQVISESGPAHAKEFAVAVSVDGRTVGQGQGRSKKLAEQEAAKNAFEKESHSCI